MIRFSTIILMLLLLSHSLISQQEMLVEFKNGYELNDFRYNSFGVVYQLEGPQLYNMQADSSFTIKLPANLLVDSTAYGFLPINGEVPGPLNKHNRIPFLLSNYQSDTPLLTVDYNGNLDFTDDTQITLDTKSGATVRVKHWGFDEAYVEVILTKNTFSKEKQDQIAAMLMANYQNRSSKLLEVKHWLVLEYKNSRIASVKVNEVHHRIGLFDFNLNGLYNDSGVDLILVEDSDTKRLSSKKAEGAVPYREGQRIQIGEQGFKIEAVEVTGKNMRMSFYAGLINKGLKPGSSLPPMEVLLNGGERITLDKWAKSQNKFVLLDFWGSWCKPCAVTLPDLKQLAQNNKDKLAVLGMYYKDSPERARSFIEKKGIDWPNGLLTEEMKERLKVDAFPTYLLTDSNGSIIFMDGSLKEIEEYLEKH